MRARPGTLALLAALVALGVLAYWLAGTARTPPAPEPRTTRAPPAGEPDETALEPVPPPELEPAPPHQPERRPTREQAPDALATVFGALSDASGQPLQGVEVVLIDGRGESHETALDGTAYRCTGLPPGDCWARATRRPYGRAAAHVPDLQPGEERRVDLTLEPGLVLEVLVLTPDGQRFDGIARRGSGQHLRGSFSALEPVATIMPLGQRFAWRQGGVGNPAGIGRFVPANPRHDPPELLGRLELAQDPPFHVALTSYQAVIASQLVSEPVERIVFPLDPDRFEQELASLSFRLIDASGAPVVDARPTLFLPGSASLTLSTGSTGRAQWNGLPPGEYGLKWLEGGLYRTFELDPGEIEDLGDISVAERRALRLRLVLAGGGPVPSGADEEANYLVFGRLDPASGAARIDRTNRIGAPPEGTIELELLPGEYVLQWQNRRYTTGPFRIDLRQRDLELTLVVHELAELLLVPDQELWPTLHYRVEDAGGIELVRGSFFGPWPVRLALPPGSTRVQAVDVNGAQRLERFITLGGEPTRLDLEP